MTSTFEQKTAEAIERGVEFLNGHLAGVDWWNQINLDKLNMNGCNCVCGQLSKRNPIPLDDKLFLDEVQLSEKLGFFASKTMDFKYPSEEADQRWSTLDEMWKAKILELRNKQ